MVLFLVGISCKFELACDGQSLIIFWGTRAYTPWLKVALEDPKVLKAWLHDACHQTYSIHVGSTHFFPFFFLERRASRSSDGDGTPFWTGLFR